MNNKLVILSSFELKSTFYNNYKWLSNAMFLLLSMVIFPFTITPTANNLLILLPPMIVTTVLLGVILITSNIFDEDILDGMLDQLLTFKVSIMQIYISKMIASSAEFLLITLITLPVSAALYNISFIAIMKIWFIIALSTPILISTSIFGALLTINLNKNAALSVLLIAPLLIFTLILIGLSMSQILESRPSSNISYYMQIIIGLSMLFIPILTWLVKFLR